MIVTIEEDENGDLYLPLGEGEELCKELGWEIGDTITWIDNGDGSWTLKKMIKAIRILRCSDGMLWYSGRIGDVVPYLGSDTDAKGPIYWSRDNGGYKNIVFQKDAELIEVE